jgi:hypothetical protein
MAVHPKLMIGAGVVVAGLGLIGAGAGATFTAQVAGSTTITSGGVGPSLNGGTGSDLHVGLDGRNISSHFAPITKDLRLKNTGTLDMPSTYLSLTATGCDGGQGAALAKALHVRLTEVTGHDDEVVYGDKVIYDGALCSFAGSIDGKGFITPRAHAGVGGQLTHALGAGKSIDYRLVIQPGDAEQGLPPEAQFMKTSFTLVFSGFDY